MFNLTLPKKLSVLLASLIFCANAFALTLQDAKDQGLVGEMRNGYLGVVVAGAAAQQIADEVNEKRRMHYEDIATRNNLTLEQVAARAGVKNLERTEAGHYIENANGQFIKKP
ncbi:YdbL family protein [Pseudoalteromonas fenneropenaei]|uniref:YdbL family protein n=1 Tax=Pseudoalteromonas fenneropenaei TaxID=1737459 RepID=A0ABV7CED4_9GAMM